MTPAEKDIIRRALRLIGKGWSHHTGPDCDGPASDWILKGIRLLQGLVRDDEGRA